MMQHYLWTLYCMNDFILPSVVTTITIIILVVVNKYTLCGFSDHISDATSANSKDKDSYATDNHENIISDKNELPTTTIGLRNQALFNNAVFFNKSQISTSGPIIQNQLPPGCKLVKNPGKALAQMVRFKLRFHRKVKRFRERHQLTEQSPTQ